MLLFAANMKERRRVDRAAAEIRLLFFSCQFSGKTDNWQLVTDN
jgi:hypothetical protein